jgi:hypothetical protein
MLSTLSWKVPGLAHLHTNRSVSIGMTLGLIHVIFGILSLFFSLGLALHALAFLVDCIRNSGLRRGKSLFFALLLAGFAYSGFASSGKDFAYLNDRLVSGMPGNLLSLVVGVVWAALSIWICVSGVVSLRSHFRSSPAQA